MKNKNRLDRLAKQVHPENEVVINVVVVDGYGDQIYPADPDGVTVQKINGAARYADLYQDQITNIHISRGEK